MNFKHFIYLSFTVLIIFSCSSNDDGNGDNASNLANFTSQICDDVSVRGPKAAYWDYAHSLPIPLTQIPVLATPGDLYTHSQHPLLGLTMPPGYSAVELSPPVIGVNIIKNDNSVVWRYVPSGTFSGSTDITNIMAFEINTILNFHGANAVSEVLCTTTSTTNGNGFISTYSARLFTFENMTALVWANMHYSPSLNSTFFSSSVSSAPTTTYDTMVMDVFLPLSFQLLYIDNGVRDSDLDGTPDSQDNFPFDHTRQ